MEIKLRVDRFCIETSAKKQYEHLLRLLLNKADRLPNDTSLEDQIEGLKCFLEETDRKALRASNPELDKGSETDVLLSIDVMKREMALLFKGKRVIPPKK